MTVVTDTMQTLDALDSDYVKDSDDQATVCIVNYGPNSNPQHRIQVSAPCGSNREFDAEAVTTVMSTLRIILTAYEKTDEAWPAFMQLSVKDIYCDEVGLRVARAYEETGVNDLWLIVSEDATDDSHNFAVRWTEFEAAAARAVTALTALTGS